MTEHNLESQVKQLVASVRAGISSKWYVYVYRDPSKDGEIFYVGKGTGPRATLHLSRTDPHPLTHRLRKMLANCILPTIAVYSACDEESALVNEELLISYIGRKDLQRGSLLNLTNGGEGLREASPETRAKMSEARKGKQSWNKGLTYTRAPTNDATKQKIRESKKGVSRSPEVKAKISNSKKGRTMSPEQKLAISNAMTGVKKSEETKLKMSAAAKARCHNKKVNNVG